MPFNTQRKTTRRKPSEIKHDEPTKETRPRDEGLWRRMTRGIQNWQRWMEDSGLYDKGMRPIHGDHRMY